MVETAIVTSSRGEMQAELKRQIANWIWPAIAGLGVLLILCTEALRWPWRVHILALLLVFLSLLAWPLLQRSYRAGVWLLVVAGLALIRLALNWLPWSVTLSLLALPAGMAGLLSGAGPGLGVAGISTLLILQAMNSPLLAGAPSCVPALIVIWGTAGLAGLASHFAGQPVEALWTSYVRMHELLEEARDQRMELKQTQQDLVHANAELARLSERLERMYQVAEEARRAKEQFVANVSHELRTPLNMIIGFSEVISEAPDAYGAELPAPLLADVEVILRNSRHLASLVDDVLDLSQVEAGQMPLSREWASLREIAEEALLAVRPLLEAKALSVAVDIPCNLPPLFCDRTRIRQVLLNLVSNAARFTERGGIRIRVERQARQVVVSVADSGPGIAAENRERIFHPFQQVDGSIRRKFGGTGLGLSISKRFVEMHDGRMWLESQLGKGSTFYFSLPTQEDAPPAAANVLRWLSAYHQENPRTRRSKAPAGRPMPRFVVLEPGNVLQRLLGRYLEDAEVSPARSFEQALEELTRSPAQALIINDPALERSASSLTRRAANLPYGTPAIACWIPGEEEAAAKLGVVRYLLKPVSRDALWAALDGLGPGIKTVLAVDDDAEVLQLFGRMLASEGRRYRVLKASSGQRALSLLRERRPDVVLLDLFMPGMDGYAFLREKRLDPEIRGAPVIVVSARDPVRESLMGNSLTLVRSGGLTLRDLLTCLRQWGEMPSSPAAAGPALPGTPGG